MNIKHQTVSKGIMSLIFSHPFFSSILLQQEFIECGDDSPIKTMAVDGKHIFFNTKFSSLLTTEECKGVLAHEVAHLALLHHTRKGSRNHDRWNRATDYAINLVLKDGGFVLPKDKKDANGEIIFGGPLLDERFRNMSAEDIYKILEDEDKKGGKNGKGQPGNGDGIPNGCGEVIQADSPDQQEEVTKMQVSQASMIEKQQGKSGSNPFNRLFKRVPPKMDWREIVNRFVTEQYPVDYSWNKPNKRFLYHNIILPSLDGKQIGQFAIAVDTSGSVSEAEISAMLSEVFGCLEVVLENQVTVSIPVIYCDDSVNGVDIIESLDDKPNVRGGGGTSFAPVFKYIQENRDGIFDGLKGLIYITDGYCGLEAITEPPFQVLWAVTTEHGLSMYKRPFGEDMYFDINQKG